MKKLIPLYCWAITRYQQKNKNVPPSQHTNRPTDQQKNKQGQQKEGVGPLWSRLLLHSSWRNNQEILHNDKSPGVTEAHWSRPAWSDYLLMLGVTMSKPTCSAHLLPRGLCTDTQGRRLIPGFAVPLFYHSAPHLPLCLAKEFRCNYLTARRAFVNHSLCDKMAC